MMSFNGLLCALALTISGPLVGTAQAKAPAPKTEAKAKQFADWAVALKRAKGDPAALERLAKQSVDHARVWAYGYVFDVVTPGIPEAEKNRVRAEVGVLADALNAQGYPGPRLLLDGESTTLTETARRVRDGIQRATDRAGVNPSSTMLPEVAKDALEVRAVFFGLLYRAYRSRHRMGGRFSVRTLVTAARRVAVDYAFLRGELGLWRALAAFEGRTTVPVIGLRIVASQEATAINSLLSGDFKAVEENLSEVREIALQATGPAPRTALLRGGIAEALDGQGRADAARKLRIVMQNELAQIGRPWMQGITGARRLQRAVARGEGRLILEELAALNVQGEAVRLDLDVLGVRLVAAKALAVQGAEAADKGALVWATELLDAADAELEALLAEPALVAAVPTAERAQTITTRRADRARVLLARATIAQVRGQLGRALSLVERARPMTDQPPVVEAVYARLLLATGALEAALEAATVADAGLEDPEARARNQAVRGWIRLRLGQLPAAFANANTALHTLRQAELSADQRPLRARLHRLAAFALDRAGLEGAAAARLEFALSVHPDPHVALDQAALLVEAGVVSKAVKALRGVSDPDAVALRGCLELRLGQTKVALKTLATVSGVGAPVSAAGSPTAPIRAGTCLAEAQRRAGQTRAARLTLNATLKGVGPHTEPALRWPLHVVQGRIEGKGAKAIAAYRAAAIQWRRAQENGAPTLDARIPGLFPNLDSAMASLSALDPKALPEVVWWAAAREAGWRPVDGDRSVRKAIAAVRAAERVRAQRLPEPAHRDAAATALAKARTVLDTRLAKLRATQPRWAAWALPQPVAASDLKPDGDFSRVYFETGDTRGRVTVITPGKAAKRWDLPGRKALITMARQARQAMGNPKQWPRSKAGAKAVDDPYSADWRRLQKVAKVLLPFVKDAKLRRAMFERDLHIWADGPLQGFPFEALVLALPTRLGVAPEFLASRWPVVHRLSAGALLPRRPGEGLKVAAIEADQQAIKAHQGGHSTIGFVDAATALAEGRYAQLQQAPKVEALLSATGLEGLVLNTGRISAPAARFAGVRWVATPGVGTSSEAAGWLWAWLSGRPLQRTLVFDGADGGVLLHRFEPVAVPVMDLQQAVQRSREFALSQEAVPGQVPAYHPTRWCRWVLAGP